MARKLPAGMRRKQGKNSIEYRFRIDGKQFSVYGQTVTECREKELEKREEIKRGKYISTKNLTMAAFLEKWIAARSRTLEPSTQKTYRKIVSMMCKVSIDKTTTFGALKLDQLETDHVRTLQNGLLLNNSTRTANDALSLLKHALNTAVKEHVLLWNPSEAVERVKRTEEPARETIHRALTKAEVDTFLEAARSRNSWYYNLYVFMLNTGLRVGEASAINRLDISGDEVIVSKTVVLTEYGYEISKHTKTAAGNRSVTLRPEAKEALKRQNFINAAIFDAGKPISTQKPVFRMQRGGIIRPDRVNTDIKKICEAASITRFTTHAFRATFASRCIASGMDVKNLMEIMGHNDVQQTLGLYAHADIDQKRDQVLKAAIM